MLKLEGNKDYNIIIVGVGGTGSHLVSFLTQMMCNDSKYSESRIVLVDEDVVETKNLKTQKFLPVDVGKNKAEVLSERYSSVYNRDILYIDRFITCKEDIAQLIISSQHVVNIIVSCVDNNAARKVIDDFFNDNKYAPMSEIIYIDTGNSAGTGELTGQTVLGYKRYNQIVLPSVSTYFPQMLKEEEPDPEEEGLSCAERMLRNAQNIGANITSACTTFNLINSVVGYNTIPGDLFTFNASRIETESMQVIIPTVTKEKE